MTGNKDSKQIPQYHSPVRHILNEVNGLSNEIFIKDFQEAKETGHSYVIMEGDWGGQIYLSCPMSLVECSEEELQTLLIDLDKVAWGCNDVYGRGLYYEIHFSEEGIGGGMITDTLWVHDEFIEKNLKDQIYLVISGERKTL
ncbi:hypothetical protein OB236_10825 [Paenibacillus sp. WQ 127069]|uniref:Uncharacterized protein n=1 Tax=Paenibacillus baimaensis TaxID=2982185 RepID=A0ABT2UD86_9BACL|nr:hypothetical protein [Paenibacillus sp. WQ 127069]MCU6792613.1 hypothetical protein [Paenibacillus sp. WQ 127069]